MTVKEQKNNIKTVRPPVVVVLGHVDHGKSTLLDYIRNENTVAGEAGGITQHVAAYEIMLPPQIGIDSQRISADNNQRESAGYRKITFIDTPGHEAFEAIRGRSTQIADIAILIVSAEEGVQAQTIEALKTIKARALPFVVAINKVDKPNANAQKTIANLAEHEVYCEGHGGDVPCALISAKTGAGVAALLELILLVADLEELTGNTEQDARGFVIESRRDARKGITATLLITDGTLSRGMYVATKASVAPTRIMETVAGTAIETATSSSPVVLTGWNIPPTVGAPFQAFDRKRDAEQFARVQPKAAQKNDQTDSAVDTDEPAAVFVPLIIKADVIGSIDAIRHELRKVTNEGIQLKVLHADVGGISEGDIKLAGGDRRAIVVGFHTDVEPGAAELAERDGITIKTFDIIYKLTEWLEEETTKRKPKKREEIVRGTVTILKVFSETKKARVVGGRVESGVVSVGDRVAILRRDEKIGDGVIKGLQLHKQEVKQIQEGNECGMKIETSVTLVPNDTLEVGQS